MLAVVVLAGLLPDTGVVSASSNCTYGKCPAATPFPLWAVSAAVVVVVLALILALLLLRRNRRPPEAAPAEGEEAPPAGESGGEWSGTQDGATAEGSDPDGTAAPPEDAGSDMDAGEPGA